jgi:hypothetical protein
MSHPEFWERVQRTQIFVEKTRSRVFESSIGAEYLEIGRFYFAPLELKPINSGFFYKYSRLSEA